MTDAHKNVVTIAIPRRLVPEVLQWIDDEMGRWPLETAYQADLAEAKTALLAAWRQGGAA